MNTVYAACQEVSVPPSSSPTPLFDSTDFTPLNCLKRNRPLPLSPRQRTVFQCGDDWTSETATTVLGALNASVCPLTENRNESNSPLSLRRSSASVEVDSSAADLFTPLIQPFSRQIRLLQCTSCRRPLLPTRLFQHMSHCPAKNDGMSAELMSLRDDPSLDLIAASYISPPSSPSARKRPRTLFVSKNASKSRPVKSEGLDLLFSPNDYRFAPPREEDDWRVSLTPLAPPFKPVSKYRRRRVFLPPPQEPLQRKRISIVEKRALHAAALISIQSIPVRSSTHQNRANNTKDPLRNIVSKDVSAFPWMKLMQIALPLYTPRNPSRRKLFKDVRNRNSASMLQSNPSSPPITPKLSSPVADAADMESLATTPTTPSLVGALLYLRGQGLPHLSHTPLASLDPPQHPLSRSGPFYHGHTHIAPIGTFWTDVRPSNDTKFSLPIVETITTTSPDQPPPVCHPPRSVPADPRTKKFALPVNQTIPMNLVNNVSQLTRPVNSSDIPAAVNQGMRQTPSALMNGPINANPQTNINTSVGVHMMSQPNLNPTLSLGPKIAANVTKGTPAALNTDGAMLQQPSYPISPSLPPLSSTIVKRQRPAKSRIPVTSTSPLPSSHAVTSKPGMSVTRKPGGTRASSALKSGQHRLQSSTTGNIGQTSPVESSTGMLLTPSAAATSAFSPNLAPQSKKSYRSSGVMPRPLATVPHEISGQQIGGISVASKPMHVPPKATRPGKVRQHVAGGTNLSGGKSTVSLGKTIVKNQSPSQGSVHSGDLSLHSGTGAASKGYDPMALAASLASNGVGGKHVPTSHVESSNQSLEFHQQALPRVAQAAGKVSIRNDSAVDLQGMISNMRGTMPAYVSDGSINHYQRHGIPSHPPSTRPLENPLAGPVARPQTSGGLKTLNLENQSHGSNHGDSMKGKADELDTQLPLTDPMHVDGPGFKEKLSNVAAKSLPNTVNYGKRLDRNMINHTTPSQGYYSSVLATAPNQTSPISATALKGQPNLNMFAFSPGGQQNAAMSPNVTGAVGVPPNSTNAAANLFQGMPDMRSLHGVRMLAGGNSLQQTPQHNIMNFFPNGPNTGLTNIPMNTGGIFNPLVSNGLMGGSSSGNDGSNGNGNATEAVNNSGANNNLNGVQASEALTNDALLQQLLAGRGGMGSEIGGSASAGLGGISLTGLQSSGPLVTPGNPNGPHVAGLGLHGGNIGVAGLNLNGVNPLGLGRAGGGLQSPHGVLPFGGGGLGDEPQREIKFNFQESDLLD